jgi:hypothetical protein
MNCFPQIFNIIARFDYSSNEFEQRKNLIFNYFDLSLSRTNLVKLAYKLLHNSLNRKNKYIVYCDGSVIDLGNFVESTSSQLSQLL